MNGYEREASYVRMVGDGWRREQARQDDRDQIIFQAILDEPGEHGRMFGKPVRFHVEWPEGPPECGQGEEWLKALARDGLALIRKRRAEEG